MAKFGFKRVRKFRISTRASGGRISIFSPGIKRPRKRAVQVRGVQQMVKG